MAKQKNLTFDEQNANETQLIQHIINCDSWIAKLYNEPDLQEVWIIKKERFEYLLQDLQTKDLI